MMHRLDEEGRLVVNPGSTTPLLVPRSQVRLAMPTIGSRIRDRPVTLGLGELPETGVDHASRQSCPVAPRLRAARGCQRSAGQPNRWRQQPHHDSTECRRRALSLWTDRCDCPSSRQPLRSLSSVDTEADAEVRTEAVAEVETEMVKLVLIVVVSVRIKTTAATPKTIIIQTKDT